MHPIILYIIIYLFLGACGMYLANKKQAADIQRERWLKFITYVLIIGVVIASIFLDCFTYIAVAIIAAGFYEIIKSNFSLLPYKVHHLVISIIIYSLFAFGFLQFSLGSGRSFLLFIYFQVFIFDAFCQVTGQLIGRHKLAPAISASKTIEGLAGGWIFCIISAMLAASWINSTLIAAACLGVLTGLTSFTGDMSGSYFKRVRQIKDFSSLLPWQGGFIDRFGSLLVTGAVFYYFHLYS